jgi:hypothetical protein
VFDLLVCVAYRLTKVGIQCCRQKDIDKSLEERDVLGREIFIGQLNLVFQALEGKIFYVHLVILNLTSNILQTRGGATI